MPLDTYHSDHPGPLPSTKKNHKYIFVVVDAFSAFVCLNCIKSKTAIEVIEKLRNQANFFENPRRILYGGEIAFTSKECNQHCGDEKIDHIRPPPHEFLDPVDKLKGSIAFLFHC